VETRPVTTGITHGGWVVIEKGVEAGERVVTGGQLRLRPGAKYEVRKNGGEGGAAAPKP